MLVATFMFSMIMVVVGGLFARTMALQRKAFLIQQTQENVNFILESMAREIRIGHACPMPTSCSSDDILDLDHPINETIQYYLSDNQVHRVEKGTDTIISSSAVKITRLKFFVAGADNFDGKQPRVTIILRARTTNGDQFSEINAQTTVSQRFLSDDYRQ